MQIFSFDSQLNYHQYKIWLSGMGDKKREKFKSFMKTYWLIDSQYKTRFGHINDYFIGHL